MTETPRGYAPVMVHPLVEAWHSAARSNLPPGIEVWDAHTHTGTADPDGFHNTADALIADLDRAGHARAVVFSNADPHGYRANNDRILEEAFASGNRLIPFARIDPTASVAVDEVCRCLREGHRGFKMHPRSEGFSLDHPGVAKVAAVAAERKAPLLIHAGRGVPSLGAAALNLVDDHPGLVLILAHGGISDLGRLAQESRTRPGLMFDTSWWNAADLAYLFANVDASQIVYASDMPYWDPQVAFTLAARSAVQAGLTGQALSAVFGGNLARALEGRARRVPLGLGLPGFVDPALLRVAANLYGALGNASAGEVHREGVELARRAADTVSMPHEPLLRAVRETIDAAAGVGDAHPFEAVELLMIACSAVLTPGSAAPEL
jgi:predicted TIM-barrel fold metal-dependent hydrolase